MNSQEGKDKATAGSHGQNRSNDFQEEINALRAASRTRDKEVQSLLENFRRTLSARAEGLPAATQDILDNLGSTARELSDICNRSLFLADDINNWLQSQQEQFLQQQASQLATSEAILVLSGEIARLMHLPGLFEWNSAQRVVQYVFAIADEFKLPRRERQALYYSALLKDMGLVFAPQDKAEQLAFLEAREVLAVKSRFSSLCNTLQLIDFLAPALVFLSYRFRRYDDTGSLPGRAVSIPLGSRILAVADSFETLTTRRSGGALEPKVAVRNIVADSGKRFDPDVVSAFIRVWRKKKLHTVLKKSC